jgi:hypothetical protein
VPAQAARRAHDPQGDLAAVGDQDGVHLVSFDLSLALVSTRAWRPCSTSGAAG